MDENSLSLSEIINNKIVLNEIGEIIEKCWNEIPNHYPECKLDAYIIMPDHFHGIVQIVRNRHVCSERRQNQTLPLAIGSFKAAASRLIHQLGFYEFKWHKSYYDRILRKAELISRRNYIRNNPKCYEAVI